MAQFPAVRTSETLSGAAGIVDLWYWPYELVDPGHLLDTCLPLLSTEEKARYERYHFERDRLAYCATRGLVRSVLSSYAPVAPAVWRFSAGPNGKPRLADMPGAPPLHFNLSNTHGLVVCGVSVAHEDVGVDVERDDRIADYAGLSARYFSAAEAAVVEAADASEQRGLFLTYWTLKESYVKARGAGLSMPLDRFTMSIDHDIPAISFMDDQDDASDWRFALSNAGPAHLVAVAVRTGGVALSVRSEQITHVAGTERS